MNREAPDVPMTHAPLPMELEESVIMDIRIRRVKGRAKYGATMDRADLTPLQWHQHLYEELLDSALYCKRIIRELEKAKANDDPSDLLQLITEQKLSPEC